MDYGHQVAQEREKDANEAWEKAWKTRKSSARKLNELAKDVRLAEREREDAEWMLFQRSGR